MHRAPSSSQPVLHLQPPLHLHPPSIAQPWNGRKHPRLLCRQSVMRTSWDFVDRPLLLVHIADSPAHGPWKSLYRLSDCTFPSLFAFASLAALVLLQGLQRGRRTRTGLRTRRKTRKGQMGRVGEGVWLRKGRERVIVPGEMTAYLAGLVQQGWAALAVHSGCQARY